MRPEHPPPAWGPFAVLLTIPVLTALLTEQALQKLHPGATLHAALIVAAPDGAALLYYAALARIRVWPSLRDRFAPVPLGVVVMALAAALCLKALFVGLAELASELGAAFPDPAPDPLLSSSLEDWAVIPAAILVAPFWEELLFRGLLIDRLYRSLSVGGAVLVSSVAFALVHDNQFALGLTGILLFAERFALGAVAAVLALRHRSLMPAFLFHAANNLIAELASVLIPS